MCLCKLILDLKSFFSLIYLICVCLFLFSMIQLHSIKDFPLYTARIPPSTPPHCLLYIITIAQSLSMPLHCTNRQWQKVQHPIVNKQFTISLGVHVLFGSRDAYFTVPTLLIWKGASQLLIPVLCPRASALSSFSEGLDFYSQMGLLLLCWMFGNNISFYLLS